MSRYLYFPAILTAIISIQSCAVKQYAMSSIGNVFAEGGELELQFFRPSESLAVVQLGSEVSR